MRSLWDTMLLRWLGRPGVAEALTALPWTPSGAPAGGFEVRRAAAGGPREAADGGALPQTAEPERVPG